MKGIDTSHPVWFALKRQMVERIEELQNQLEKPSDPDATNVIRGRIAELRKILRETEPQQKEHQHARPIY